MWVCQTSRKLKKCPKIEQNVMKKGQNLDFLDFFIVYSTARHVLYTYMRFAVDRTNGCIENINLAMWYQSWGISSHTYTSARFMSNWEKWPLYPCILQNGLCYSLKLKVTGLPCRLRPSYGYLYISIRMWVCQTSRKLKKCLKIDQNLMKKGRNLDFLDFYIVYSIARHVLYTYMRFAVDRTNGCIENVELAISYLGSNSTNTSARFISMWPLYTCIL